MIKSFFLGANSKDGFASLYGGFCRVAGDYLSVIKGGPGTGKSGFMRAVGRAAEARGLDVEYVLCSGDPDSLDGVYIPALRRGWVDGTAPHAAEPSHFGVDGDYVNLEQFCAVPLDEGERGAVKTLYDDYRREYAAAYGYLASAWEVRRAYLPQLFTGELADAMRRRIGNILRRCRVRDAHEDGAARHCARYLHGYTCKGEIWLGEEITRAAETVYLIDDGYGGAAAALTIAAEEADALGASAIYCRDPLDKARLDALILPEWGVAFASAGYDAAPARHIRLDAAIDPAAIQGRRGEIREGRQIEARLKNAAISHLAEAKRKHDELEAHYTRRMDFAALTEYTERYVSALFGGK